jgi:cell division protein FtsA
LAGNSDEEISSPLYATAVGLVMNSLENKTQSAVRANGPGAINTNPVVMPTIQKPENEESGIEVEMEREEIVDVEISTDHKIRSSFFGGYLIKIKDFLDNAE